MGVETTATTGALDDLLDRFERAWQSGAQPVLEEFLPEPAVDGAPTPGVTASDGASSTDAYRRALVELVMVDLWHRWQAAATGLTVGQAASKSQSTDHQPQAGLPERPLLEDYVRRYSALGPLAELPGDLVREEYRARRLAGERIDHDHFLMRFGPARRNELRLLLEAVDAEIDGSDRTDRPPALTATRVATDRPSTLQVRCPFCHNAVETPAEGSFQEIRCLSCGGSFNLLGDSATRQSAALRTVGHFDLVEQLGAGAFGMVWKARDRELDRTVAVKIPRKDQLSKQEAELFLREARAAAQLRHPNIVTVHEVGREADTIYIVSDLVRGVTLADWLTGQRLTAREAARLCAKVADALAHAHHVGIVHRDIKPGNIMLDADGEPYLTDFGLAKRSTGDVMLTVEGKVLGTPAYMSPEQARGEGHQADGRSDIYSLGVVLFQLLTGELPFRGNPNMLIMQILRDEPPSPRKLNSRVPRDLETICLKCLEKEPAKRYATAKELGDDLRRYLGGSAVLARPIGRPARLWRWSKRNPVVAGLAAAIALLLTAISVVSLAGYFWTEELRQQAETLAGEKVELANSEAEQRRQSEALNADLLSQFGFSAQYENGAGAAALLFAHAARKSPRESAQQNRNLIRAARWSERGFRPVAAFAHDLLRIDTLTLYPAAPDYLIAMHVDDSVSLWDLRRESRFNLPPELHTVVAATWDATGKWLALGLPSGSVEVMSFPDLEVRYTIRHSGLPAALSFSPDGRYLAIGSAVLRVWDHPSRKFANSPVTHPNKIEHVIFSPRGDRLAASCWDGSTGLFKLDDAGAWASQPYASVRHHMHGSKEMPFRASPPRWLNDGRELLTSMGESLAMWNGQSGTKLRDIKVGPHQLFAVSIDQRHVGTAQGSQIRFWDLLNGSGGDSVFHKQGVTAISSVPQTGMIAVTGHGREVEFFNPQRAGRIATLNLSNNATALAFSADGQHLAAAHNEFVRVWRPYWSRELTQPRIPFDANCVQVNLSADGRFFVPAGTAFRDCNAKTTQVFDTESGKRVTEQLDAGGILVDAALSNDAGVLVTAASRASREDRTAKPGLQPGLLRLWDRGTSRKTAEIELANEPRDVEFSPQGNQFAVRCAGGEILIVDAAGKTVRTWSMPHACRDNKNYLTNGKLRFSGDGRYLVNYGETPYANISDPRFPIRVYDVAHGELRYEPLAVTSLVFDATLSSDGAYLATAQHDRIVQVWDFQRGRTADESSGPLVHPDWVMDVEFSKDGRHLLTACRDGMVRLWDWRKGEMVFPPLQHRDEAFEAKFSPDGRWIVTASADGFVRICDALSGQIVMLPIPCGGSVWDLDITPDGKRIVAASRDGAVHLLRFDELTATEPLSAEALCDWTELVAGMTLHQNSGLANLAPGEWLKRWQTFRGRHPERFGQAVKSSLANAKAQEPSAASISRRALSHQHWFQAALRAMKESQPGEALSALEKSLDVMTDFNGERYVIYLYAVLCGQIGDREKHAAACRRMLDELDDQAPVVLLDRAVRACLLLDREMQPVDSDRLRRFAERAVAESGAAETASLYQFSIGLLEFRAGRSSQSIDLLEKCRGGIGDSAGSSVKMIKALANIVLAMALKRQDQAASVQHLLDEAAKLQKAGRAVVDPDQWASYTQITYYQTLRAEAEQMLSSVESKADAEPQPTK